MLQITIAVLYGLLMVALGSATTWGLLRTQLRRAAREKEEAVFNNITEAINNLHGVADRVARDVENHNKQVGELNNTLIANKDPKPSTIIDVVAKLIDMNSRMQEQLSSAKLKLRKQAKQIKVSASKARTDALTLLANRRAFDEQLVRQVAEYRRQHRVFSLISVDVDHFKSFNDRYGHPAGDEVLRHVARILQRTVRDMDFVARYGGEEFLIILPGTNLENASRAATRACAAISSSTFGSRVNEYQLTVSCGVAEIQVDEDGYMLIARADKALYAAKNNGRNRAYRHDGRAISEIAVPARVVPEPKAETESGAGEASGEPSGAPHAGGSPPEAEPAPLDTAGKSTDVDLASRTAFCQRVRDRTDEWNDERTPFSVVLITADAAVQGGGQAARGAGDAVTSSLLRSIGATGCDPDIVGEYAPGCTALVLMMADITDVIRFTKDLRAGVRKNMAQGQGNQAALNLNVGVAQPLDQDDSMSLLKRAEAALQTAGKEGLCVTYLHDGSGCVPITAMSETLARAT